MSRSCLLCEEPDSLFVLEFEDVDHIRQMRECAADKDHHNNLLCQNL